MARIFITSWWVAGVVTGVVPGGGSGDSPGALDVNDQKLNSMLNEMPDIAKG